MKNFINISDLSSQDLRLIIDEAKKRKAKRVGLNKSSADQDSQSINKDSTNEEKNSENK